MKRALVFALAGLVMLACPALAADWGKQAATSKLEIGITFEGTTAPGEFKVFDTHLHLDPASPVDNLLDVTIDATSLDMNSADVNAAIGGVEWFDFAHFPRAQFHATQISKVAGNRYLARGTLELKGVKQAVDVPFTWTEAPDTARMEGQLVVERRVFGIGTGEWSATTVIGPGVTIKFNVQLKKLG